MRIRALSTHPLSRQDCRFHNIVYHTFLQKSIERDEKMRQKLFRRLGALLVAVLMLLPVLAMPIVAEDAETGQQASGFAVYQFENLKTLGENLSGQIQYLGDSGVAAYPYLCSVDLMPDTWYYLRYSGAATQTNHTPVYMLYHGSKLTFSPDSVAYTEFILYTGKQSGTCRLEIYSPDALPTRIADHALYRVSSFDTVYDVRYTSFAQDHDNLFPEIDLSKYKGVTGDFIELLTVYENITIAEDYTWDGQVYLYLFNPSGKQITGGTLTCPDEDGKSSSFSLIPVVTMEDVSAEDWRFMKLEVTGHWWHQYEKNDDGSVNIHTRRRQITDLTLKFEDGSSKTFPYNGSFVIEDKQTGDKVTAKSVTGKFEPQVNLEINYTYYRTDTSPNGAYYHNQVDSIYFNVPNYLKESYGKLTDVKLSYQRARTQPIIATDNQALYEALLANIGVNVPTFDNTKPTLYHFDSQVNNQLIYDFTYNKNLNAPAGSHVSLTSKQKCDRLWFAFLVDNIHAGIRQAGSTVSRKALQDWLYSNTAKVYPPSFVGPIPPGVTVTGAKGPILSEFFSEVDEITTVNVASLDLKADSYKKNHLFLSQWAEYGFFYAIGGTSTDLNLNLSEKIVAIEREWQLAGNSDTLYYAESDEADLQNCFQKSKANDSTMYLVRFNVSQYREVPLQAELNGKWYDPNDSQPAYMAEQDVYLNLHVLELTYENESGNKTVGPVTSNHIDCIADITNEKDPADINHQAGQELGFTIGSFWQKLLDKLSQFGKILALILGIVALVLIAVFVVPVVSPIFKAIFGVIGSVFRWIGEKFKGASAKRKQRRSGRR